MKSIKLSQFADSIIYLKNTKFSFKLLNDSHRRSKFNIAYSKEDYYHFRCCHGCKTDCILCFDSEKSACVLLHCQHDQRRIVVEHIKLLVDNYEDIKDEIKRLS